MTEEQAKVFSDLRAGVRMMLDKLERVSREKTSWSLCELGELADIIKDLAKAEKDIAKSFKIHGEHSQETF